MLTRSLARPRARWWWDLRFVALAPQRSPKSAVKRPKTPKPRSRKGRGRGRRSSDSHEEEQEQQAEAAAAGEDSDEEDRGNGDWEANPRERGPMHCVHAMESSQAHTLPQSTPASCCLPAT